MGALVLGIDPGFASLGWAIVRFEAGERPRVDALGLVRTAKSKKKPNVRVSSDNYRRSGELFRALYTIITAHYPDAVCMEGFSAPPSSSVAAQLGRAFGVITSLTEMHRLPVVEVTPQGIKSFLTGSQSATKQAVIEAVSKRVDLTLVAVEDKARIPKTKLEHPYDAIGAALAAETSDVMRAVLRVGGPVRAI